jgi:hypothetical protein
LREVCQWAGVGGNESARVKTTSDVSAWLDGVLSDLGNASRARRLATLHGEARLEEFVRLRTSLAAEAAALTAIAGQRNAFEHLASSGSVDDKTVVVTRLKNLLADGFAVGLLSDGAATWVEEAKRRYALVAGDAERRAREQRELADTERRAREEADRRRVEAESAREAAERETRALEAQIAAVREAQAVVVRQLEQQRDTGTAGVTARVATGSRETIGAAVQKQLGEMLAEHPKLKEIRVRIVIEEVEPGKS